MKKRVKSLITYFLLSDVMPDRNGKGPRKGSYMWNKGKRGRKQGHKKGTC